MKINKLFFIMVLILIVLIPNALAQVKLTNNGTRVVATSCLDPCSTVGVNYAAANLVDGLYTVNTETINWITGAAAGASATIDLNNNYTIQNIVIRNNLNGGTARPIGLFNLNYSTNNVTWTTLKAGLSMIDGTVNPMNLTAGSNFTQFNARFIRFDNVQGNLGSTEARVGEFEVWGTNISSPVVSNIDVNGTLNKSTIFMRDVINATFNASSNYNISSSIITINDTGVTRTFNVSYLGTSGTQQFSQNFSISCSPCVVNITGIVNDTTGASARNTTIFNVVGNIMITATDVYDGSSINNFSINFSNGPSGSFNVSTNNGQITITNITNGAYDILFTSEANGGYYSQFYPGVNVQGQTLNIPSYQAIVLINATEIITGNTLIDFGVSVPLQYNTSKSTNLVNTISENLASSSFESQGCATGDGGLSPAIDGDWNTYTNRGTVFENYTKVPRSLNASFKFGLVYNGPSGGFNTSCWDGSQWRTVFNATGIVPIRNPGNMPVNMTVGIPSSCFSQNTIQIKTVALASGSDCDGGCCLTSFSRYYEGAMNYTVQNDGFANLLLKAGTYNIIGNKTGYINSSSGSLTILPLDNRSLTLEFGTNQLRIDAKSILTGAYINTFTIILSNGSYVKSKNTTSGNLTFDLVVGNYSLMFSTPSFANQNGSININSLSIYPNMTFSVYTTNSVNFTIYDEILGKTNFFNGTIVNLAIISNSYSVNYTTSNGNLYVDLLNPSTYRVEYYSSNYPKRDYYFTLTNSTHTDIELYLLSLGNSTNVIYTIQDNIGNNLEGATVYLQRYYIDSNSYKTVAMGKSNEEGEVVFNVDFNDAFYKVVAVYGNFMSSTVGSKIFQLSLTLPIETETNPLEELDNIQSISSLISYNNNTKYFTMTAINLEGTSLPFTLKISKVGGLGEKTQVCSSSDTFASGTILCYYNITADPGQFFAEGLVNLDGYVNQAAISSLTVSFNIFQENAKAVFGKDGLLYSLIISGTFALIGSAAGPIGALVGFIAGFGASLVIGFAFFDNGLFNSIMVFMSLLILVGAIAWRISR